MEFIEIRIRKTLELIGYIKWRKMFFFSEIELDEKNVSLFNWIPHLVLSSFVNKPNNKMNKMWWTGKNEKYKKKKNKC